MKSILNLINENFKKGDTLYSLVHGELILMSVDMNKNNDYPITCKCRDFPFNIVFDEYGRFKKGCGECILFPSKDNKKWNFKNKTLHLQLSKNTQQIYISDTIDNTESYIILKYNEKLECNKEFIENYFGDKTDLCVKICS